MIWIYWLTALLSLIAVWLNIQKHVACFFLWAVTNAAWAYADLTHGLLPQAILQLVYLGLSIYGIWAWRKRDGEAAAS